MAIERNVMAMRQIEPMAEEVTRLRDGEENEGQPIGRMTYRLRSRTLNGSQINAVARLYGDKGDEVVQHLMRNPVAVLPLVYRRLRQKDAEWRRIKSELAKEWNAVLEANYEGSLDVLCSSFKKELERIVSPERLQEVSVALGNSCIHTLARPGLNCNRNFAAIPGLQKDPSFGEAPAEEGEPRRD